MALKKKPGAIVNSLKLEICNIFLCTPVSTSGMKYHNLNLYIEQMNTGSLMKKTFCICDDLSNLQRVIRGGI